MKLNEKLDNGMKYKERIIYLFISLAIGILYLYVSFLTGIDYFRTIDLDSMMKLQSAFTRQVDIPFSFFSLLGSSEVTSAILFIIFITLLFKKRRLALGLSLFFVLFLIEFAGKLLIFHPAPPKILNRYTLGFHFPSSYIIHTSFSYPSGHMARSTYTIFVILFLVLSLAFSKSKKVLLITALFFLLVMMFMTRIYLGEHWFSDVLGGTLLGAGIAFLTFAFW